MVKMENTLERELYGRVKQADKAERVLLGFREGDMVYVCVPPEDIILERLFTRLQSTKHDCKKALALRRLTDKQRARMITEGAVPVCSWAFLWERVQEYSSECNNRGWGFQWAMQDLMNQPRTPRGDKIGFWEAPDVIYNGIGYQLKFDQAQIASYEDIEKHGGERA